MKCSALLFLVALAVCGCSTNAPKFTEVSRPNELESMLTGFPSCSFNGVYVENGVPQHPYLEKLGTNNLRLEGEFAYYTLNTQFHGLHAVQLTVPTSTFGVVALTLDEPETTARPTLESALGVHLPNKSDNAVPVLYADPHNPKMSILDCTNPT